MFGEQFYPTPESLIKKMLKPYEKGDDYRYEKYNSMKDLMILEPSAGKGSICDFIIENCRYKSKEDFEVIELDVDLASILKEKGYNLVSQNFLEFNENTYYDLIIMNPPFKNGDEHLLHAIDIATNTKIICLLNAETILNPYTERRALLRKKLEDLNATIEFLNEEFKDAERSTLVTVALITFDTVDTSGKFDFKFNDFENVKLDFDFDIASNSIARKDLVGNMNIRYEEVRKYYTNYLKAEAEFNHFFKLFIDGERFVSSSDWTKKDGSPEYRFNYLSKRMKIFMWRRVIDHLDIRKYMSSSVSNNFEKFIQQQSNMAFTKENVALFFQMIMNSRKNIWDQAVLDVFDELTKYTIENRYNVEGWRTNDKYKINRKIILPNMVKYGDYMDAHSLKTYGDTFSVAYDSSHKYSDIDKVMSYLSGHTLHHLNTIEYAIKQLLDSIGRVRTGYKFENTCSSAYFDIKFFKKGTVHLTFKDKELWDYFNLTACGLKNWLPGPEKTKWEEEKKKRREYRKETGSTPNVSAEPSDEFLSLE